MVAVYATFMNRAYDQVLMDVALHKAPVTFVLDRAGVTGDDGASHNGMWDLSIFQTVPGLQIAAHATGNVCASSSPRRSPSTMRQPWCGTLRERCRPR